MHHLLDSLADYRSVFNADARKFQAELIQKAEDNMAKEKPKNIKFGGTQISDELRKFATELTRDQRPATSLVYFCSSIERKSQYKKSNLRKILESHEAMPNDAAVPLGQIMPVEKKYKYRMKNNISAIVNSKTNNEKPILSSGISEPVAVKFSQKLKIPQNIKYEDRSAIFLSTRRTATSRIGTSVSAARTFKKTSGSEGELKLFHTSPRLTSPIAFGGRDRFSAILSRPSNFRLTSFEGSM